MRESHRRATRSAILEAAKASFVGAGFAATSVNEITAAAGTSRQTFYLHFHSKAEVILELIAMTEAEETELCQLLTEAVMAGNYEAISGWLNRAFDFWESFRDIAMVQEEAATLHPEVRLARQEGFERGVAAIASGLDQIVRWDEPKRRLRGILAYSQLQALFHRWLSTGWDTDRQEVLETMAAMWMAAFTPRGDR
jgi:AcrR family transcriptional regulator